MTAEATRALLEPRSVAVIGASQDPAKPGSVLLRSLLGGAFPGRAYPINPRAETIADLRAYPSIAAVPERVDLAFVVLRREQVLGALEECAAAGTKAVAIVTAGFGESDEWGRAEQARISSLLAEHGMGGIGPNTIGLVTMGGALRGSFVRFPEWQDGPVAVAAQSGIFAGTFAEEEMARPHHRLGMHATVSIGNRVATGEVELLEAFDANPAIETIGLYLESFADASRFLETAARVKQHKPVVVLKAGRTEAGARAAASHTGSFALDDAVVDQLLRQHGIIRAEDEEDFLAILRGFALSPVAAGPRLGVVTFSGALGVLSTDMASEHRLELVPYAQGTLARLASLAPEWQRPRNPVDLWPAVDLSPRNALIEGLGAALDDPGVDQVLGILLAVPNAHFDGIGDELAALRARAAGKPLHLVIRGGLRAEWTVAVEGLGIPVHGSVRHAVRALAASAWWTSVREAVPSAYDSSVIKEVA